MCGSGHILLFEPNQAWENSNRAGHKLNRCSAFFMFNTQLEPDVA